MRVLMAIDDREAKSLDDFKKRHAACDDYVSGMTKASGDCFTYTYIPTSLSGLVTVECACGARWSCSDFGISETEARAAREVDYDDIDIEVVKLALAIVRRPGLICSSPQSHSDSVEAYTDGICAVLGKVNPDSAFIEIMQRHLVRIERRAGPDKYNLGHTVERLIEAEGGNEEAFEAWREELYACLREEFPEIAKEAGLLSEEDSR